MLDRAFPITSAPYGSTHRWRGIAIAATLLLDVTIISAIALLLPFFRLNNVEHEGILRLLGFLLSIYMVSAFSVGVYDSAAFKQRRSYIGRPARALILAYILMFIAFFLLKVSDNFSRLLVALLAVLTIPAITFVRIFLFDRVIAPSGLAETAQVLLIDGVNSPATRPSMEVIDAQAYGISTDLSDIRNINKIADLGGRVERIVVHCEPHRRLEWANLLKCLAVRSEIIVPELGPLRPLAIGDSEPMSSVVVAEHPLLWRQAVTKRLFDVLVSATIILALSPVFIVTALAIRLESPGPILFLQKRVGYGNKTFVMLKFRSMRHAQADIEAKMLTRRGDARMTRVGAFIRRTSLDELPQLFNVLLGDMSLVGPRPHAPAALAGEKLYWEVDQKYWHRHIAKPGITGLAQVRGFRGNTFEEADLQSRLDSDLEYVANWSLTNDIEILLATLRVLVHDKAF
jgi:exopolysaccharide biosynthesis polyprenyl glycosylphosphotransferase